MAHEHEDKRTEPEIHGWTSCVAPMGCSGAAHGGVTIVEVCECGAKRRIESNGRHENTSDWEEQDSDRRGL